MEGSWGLYAFDNKVELMHLPIREKRRVELQLYQFLHDSKLFYPHFARHGYTKGGVAKVVHALHRTVYICTPCAEGPDQSLYTVLGLRSISRGVPRKIWYMNLLPHPLF